MKSREEKLIEASGVLTDLLRDHRKTILTLEAEIAALKFKGTNG